MPEAEIKKRGGAKRYRTIVPKPGKYIHVAVVPKAGPRGGRTVAGEVHANNKYRGPAHGGYPHHSPAKPL
jgi:hypothetical protein